MQSASISAVDAVNPLIKLVKQRQDLYFELLSFVNKNIQSSSNDLDHLTVFNNFLATLHHKNNIIRGRENAFLLNFQDGFAEGRKQSDDPKEMLRLSSRLIEILEASITKVRKSVFEDAGRAIKEFNRFKIMLNKILKRETFIVKDYTEYVVSYCNNKFQKQVLKLSKYIGRVEQGEDVWFKDLYFNQASDAEVSPNKGKEESREAKTERKIDMTEHLSSTEEQEKKVVTLKKPTKLATKRKERLLNIRNKQKQEEPEEPATKEQTANKLLKFYSLLQLNKKQFLQDYIYDKMQQQKHKQELMNKLLQRNKEINKQINNFVKKSSAFIPTALAFSANKSSGDERNQRNQSASSKLSLRTSFIIKRKSSFHFESSDSEKKEKEKQHEGEVFQRTIRNIQPRRRSSHSNARPQDKSKKLFVVKAPMVFQQEIIPQAQITQTQWFQAPLSTKPRQRKHDNLRLKRKNNPNPLENAFFPQNFRYPL